MRLGDLDALNTDVALFMTENAYLNMTALDVLKMVSEWIAEAPAIDAVPVVRCKDCKHGFERSGRKPFGCYLHGKNGITLHDGDDFCSYGERREEI